MLCSRHTEGRLLAAFHRSAHRTRPAALRLTRVVPPIYLICRRNLGILHPHRIPFPACTRSSTCSSPSSAKSSLAAQRFTQKSLPATAGSCPETEKAPAIASEGETEGFLGHPVLPMAWLAPRPSDLEVEAVEALTTGKRACAARPWRRSRFSSISASLDRSRRERLPGALPGRSCHTRADLVQRLESGLGSSTCVVGHASLDSRLMDLARHRNPGAWQIRIDVDVEPGRRSICYSTRWSKPIAPSPGRRRPHLDLLEPSPVAEHLDVLALACLAQIRGAAAE